MGHVMCARSSAPSATELVTRARGRGRRHRLRVAPHGAPRARRRGVARGLLEVVVQPRRSAVGRFAVLDVLARDASAIALYEASGWRRLGEIPFAFNGSTIAL